MSIKSNLLFLLFSATVLSTYKYMQNLSPEFLMFFIQMMLLWFVVEIVYLLLPSLKTFVLVVLLIWGVVEAVWGVAQGDSGTCTKEGGIIFV